MGRFWKILGLVCIFAAAILAKSGKADWYADSVRQGLGSNYGPPDPNTSRWRIADDFFVPSNSLNWWTIISGQGQINVVYNSIISHNCLQCTSATNCSQLVVKCPASGSLNTKKRSVVFFLQDETPGDVYGYQVDCKIKAKTGPSTFKWYTLRYISENGTPAEAGDTISFYLGASFKDGAFHEINRNLEEDLRQFHSTYFMELFDTVLVRGCFCMSEFIIWDRLASIEGYANASSIAQGGQIQFHVSMTRHDIDSSYYFEILRAGATLESKYVSSNIQGHFRNLPANSYRVGCGWPRDTIFTIPTNWPSGIYLVKLVATNGDFNYIPFVVREDIPGSTSKILFQVSDATWQAYNFHGGASYYVNYIYNGRPTLSFDRPYLESYFYLTSQSDTVGNRGEHGAGQFFKWEYPLVQWLEQQGYTVEYCGNGDLFTQPYTSFLDFYNLYLSVGHDEYVAIEARDKLKDNFRFSSNPFDTTINAHARNLAFLSGNNIYWRVIFQNGNRQIYNNYSPSHNFWNASVSTVGVRGKLTACNKAHWNVVGGPLYVKPGMASHWIFRTNVGAVTDSFGIGQNYTEGISGYEIDYRALSSATAEYPADSVDYNNIKVLADHSYGSPKAEAVYYEYPNPVDTTVKSRSKIFTSGCIAWSWGLLDSDGKTSRITKNIIDGLAATVRGRISQNVTWSGNIYLGGDVTIDSGVTVTISSGTKIYFFPNNDVERTGGDTTKTRLIVKGTLNCLGTQTDSIIFSSASTAPTRGDWGGVLFLRPGRGNVRFTRFSYADTVLSVRGDTATVVVRNSTFTHFKTLGVYSRSNHVNLGITSSDCGKNNVWMKTAESTAKALNQDSASVGVLNARGNYWDSVPPPAAWFVGYAGSVNYSFYYTQPATPASNCPGSGGGGCGGGEIPCKQIVDAPKPMVYALSQNYPNPFNPATVIRYSIPEQARVELRVFNILGQVVATLVNEEHKPGVYEILWEGRDDNGISVSSGVYLYQIRAGDYVETKKMSLVK